MALLVVLAVIVGYFLICGWVCRAIARKRGLNEEGWWLMVGVILGPISWIAVALWPRPKPSPNQHLSA